VEKKFAPGSAHCPNCNQIGLDLADKGTSPEGQFIPVLRCKSGCGWERVGKIEPGIVVFAFDSDA